MKLMKALKADEIHEVPIEEGVKAHLDAIGHSQKYQGDSDTAYENAQARMRTYILMDAANMKNGLVVGTRRSFRTGAGLVHLQRRSHVHVRCQCLGAEDAGAVYLPGLCHDLRRQDLCRRRC
jgi:hypothetical protein